MTNSQTVARKRPAPAVMPEETSPLPAKPSAQTDSGAPQPRGGPVQSKSTQPTGSPNIKRGRPRIGEKAAQPWIALGLTERTYYRRQAEKAKTK